jgi:hypothetical protein
MMDDHELRERCRQEEARRKAKEKVRSLNSAIFKWMNDMENRVSAIERSGSSPLPNAMGRGEAPDKETRTESCLRACSMLSNEALNSEIVADMIKFCTDFNASMKYESDVSVESLEKQVNSILGRI